MHRAEMFALIEIPSVSNGITEREHGVAVAPRRRSAKQPHQQFYDQ